MEWNVRILGVPTDYGANRRGTDMGPSAIRYAGPVRELKPVGISPADTGNPAVPYHVTRDANVGMTNTKHVKKVEEVTRNLADTVSTALAEEATPFALGDDHSIVTGSLVGSARDADIGAIWFDAHGDFNMPSTSLSGNVHDMPLTVTLDIDDSAGVERANAAGPKEEDVAIVDLCSVDDAEAEAICDSDVTVYTMSGIDKRGITGVTNNALNAATGGADGVYISLDLDWLDPRETPGIRTSVRGGVTYHEVHAAMELVARSEAMRSFKLVEVNPILDEHNETATFATELAASVFGERIL